MLILRDPALASRIADSGLRALVEVRFAQVWGGAAYDHREHGYMIVVEPGDSVESLEAESGCSILNDPDESIHFGHPEFSPACEVLDEHPGCFEMAFILNDDGFAIALFIPKRDGVDADLLAMCAAFAEPARSPSLRSSALR